MEPYLPFVSSSDTSRAAAQSLSPTKVVSIREKVYECIEAAGSFGRTDEELQMVLRLSGSTEQPRRIELAKAGRIYAATMPRATVSKRNATVWKAVGY